MLQKIFKSSSKFEMGSISTCEKFRCQNCSKCEQFQQQNFPTFFKAFHSVNFLLTNSQLVLFVSLSCLVYSLVRVGTFSCLVHSLVRVGRFSCRNYPTVNNFDKSRKI